MENVEPGPKPGQDTLEAAKKVELLEHYDVETCQPTDGLWERIGKDILHIEISSFGQDAAFDEAILKRDFENTRSVIILIKIKGTDTVVGFTYAKPTVDTYPEDFPERKAAVDTAYVFDTAVEKSHRRKGLLPLMFEKLEDELLIPSLNNSFPLSLDPRITQ